MKSGTIDTCSPTLIGRISGGYTLSKIEQGDKNRDILICLFTPAAS